MPYLIPLTCASDIQSMPRVCWHSISKLPLQPWYQCRPNHQEEPPGNSIVERLHQSVASFLRTMRDIYGPIPEISSDRIIEDALQSAAYALRISTNNTLGVSLERWYFIVICYSTFLLFQIYTLYTRNDKTLWIKTTYAKTPDDDNTTTPLTNAFPSLSSTRANLRPGRLDPKILSKFTQMAT